MAKGAVMNLIFLLNILIMHAHLAAGITSICMNITLQLCELVTAIATLVLPRRQHALVSYLLQFFGRYQDPMSVHGMAIGAAMGMRISGCSLTGFARISAVDRKVRPARLASNIIEASRIGHTWSVLQKESVLRQ
jgi:hypothetical protein